MNGRNRLQASDRDVHDWYRFVLSYPPHLVRDYLERFDIGSGQRVLDPFCGTGTTLVECRKLGITSVGIEANPMACLASKAKVDWSPDPDELLAHAQSVAEAVLARLREQGIDDDFFFSPATGPTAPLHSLPPERMRLLLKNSISPLPLHKTLVLLDTLEELRDDRFHTHERVALAKALIDSIGNVHFGPEVGVRKPKADAPVTASWLDCVRAMVRDLSALGPEGHPPAQVHEGDARDAPALVEPHSIDAVITSPPYPNEKDYTRTTRLESVLLGLIHDRKGLRAMKQGLMRSNTRNVFVADDDDQWVSGHPEVERIAESIEARRIELGKTSGFERNYHRAVRLYFGGMARHFAGLRAVLRPGARLAYVVGDQASYLRVMIRTGQILADIAQSLGYELINIGLFRTRFSTATRQHLREEVLLLRWPGQPVTSQRLASPRRGRLDRSPGRPSGALGSRAAHMASPQRGRFTPS